MHVRRTTCLILLLTVAGRLPCCCLTATVRPLGMFTKPSVTHHLAVEGVLKHRRSSSSDA